MGSALITGATSGIGLELAWELAAERNDLVLVARGLERLESVAEQIRQKAGVQVELLPADLATEEGARAVAARLYAENKPIGILVNNVGFGLSQEFVGGDLERELYGLDAMVRATLITCHAAAEVMARRGYGAILNISSMASLTAQGTYSAHKAWVRTFTEGLAVDLKGSGVAVAAICPGLVHTDFHSSAGVDAGQWPEYFFTTPAHVARVSLNALRHGRVIVTPTLRYKTLAALLKVAPRALVRAVAGPEMSGRPA